MGCDTCVFYPPSAATVNRAARVTLTMYCLTAIN